MSAHLCQHSSMWSPLCQHISMSAHQSVCQRISMPPLTRKTNLSLFKTQVTNCARVNAVIALLKHERNCRDSEVTLSKCEKRITNSNIITRFQNTENKLLPPRKTQRTNFFPLSKHREQTSFPLSKHSCGMGVGGGREGSEGGRRV